jgi:hypothetical protein
VDFDGDRSAESVRDAVEPKSIDAKDAKENCKDVKWNYLRDRNKKGSSAELSSRGTMYHRDLGESRFVPANWANVIRYGLKPE